MVLFGTYQAIGWTGAMEQHLRGRGTSVMDFNQRYANRLRLEVADPVRTLTWAEGVEIRQANRIVFKNDRVLPELYRQIARTAAIEVGSADIIASWAKSRAPTAKLNPPAVCKPSSKARASKHTLGAPP